MAAKSVKLTGENADLLARVTGQKKTLPMPPTAPPAGVGFKGKPPIPRGMPVFTPNPESLTPEERQKLQEINWKPGEQITGNIADLMNEVKQSNDAEMAAELDRMANSTAGAQKFAPVDASTLSPEQQAEVRRRMAETMAAVNNDKAKKEEIEGSIGMSPGVRDALKVATAPHGIEVEDDRQQTAATQPTDTGITSSHPGNCPHCGWDQSVVEDIKISNGDKVSMLHAILGEKPFSKDYSIFGGNVTVTFRGLTGPEIDTIYRQVFNEQKRGEIQTDGDFYERVNRYRLYLQLVSVKSGVVNHEFPDGFTAATNPTAVAFYELPADLPEGETGLRAVEAHIVKTALKTEHMIRTVTNECRRFNRLVSKLEIMADHPDFWEATGDSP